jgi:hypothetical protein
MQDFVTQSEFAKLRRVTRQTVSAWKARGLLVRIGNKVHVEASNRLLDARLLKYRGGTASRRSTVDAPAPEHATPLPDDFKNWTHAEAVRKKEICLALTRQLQLDIVRGKYAAIADVMAGWSRIVNATRNAMLALPANARLRLQLTAEQTKSLDDMIRAALTTVAMTEPPKDEPSQ